MVEVGMGNGRGGKGDVGVLDCVCIKDLMINT